MDFKRILKQPKPFIKNQIIILVPVMMGQTVSGSVSTLQSPGPYIALGLTRSTLQSSLVLDGRCTPRL